MGSMAFEGDVKRSLLDRTDAEKVFRPWWDTLEDMLLNTLIALGKTEDRQRPKSFIGNTVLIELLLKRCQCCALC